MLPIMLPSTRPLPSGKPKLAGTSNNFQKNISPKQVIGGHYFQLHSHLLYSTVNSYE